MDNNRILDDLTRVAGGAFTVFSALGKQIQSNIKDNMGNSMGASAANDDVTRLQGVVTKLRIEQEELKIRVAELEAALGKKPKMKAAPVSKAAPKKAAVKSKAGSTKAKKTKKRA